MNRLLARAPGPLRTMATNSGWLITGTGVRMLVGLVTAVWLTRYLGPTDFGLFSYVTAFVLIFTSASTLGMQSLVTRELVEQPHDRHQILGSAVTIRLFGSLVAAAVLLILTFALHPEADYRVALVVFGGVLLVQPIGLVEFHYEARTTSRFVVWVQLAAAVAYIVAVAVMISMDLSVIWFVVARLGEVVLANLGVLAVFSLQGGKPTKWRPDPARMRLLLAEAWPLAISAVAASLYLRIDQVMLGQLATAADVGIYAAAARLSEVWYFIPGLIVASAFPYLVRLRSRELVSYHRRLQQLYDILFWMGLIIAGAVAFLAPWLISLLYGDAFADASSILQIHVWAGVFIFMRAALSKWLLVERLIGFSLVTQGAGAIVNIAANLALIPRLGGVGAAWATVVSYAVASFLAPLAFPPTRPAAWMMAKTVAAPLRFLKAPLGGARVG